MSNVRLKVFPGTYDNEMAYENVINYVTAKAHWGGYGFFPYNAQDIVSAFAKSRDCSLQSEDRQLWHFTITFSQKFEIHYLYQLANEIAFEFANDYQIIFAVDTEGCPHLHFAVNAFSYHPNTCTLSPDKMRNIACHILKKLHNSSPLFQHTTLDFPKEV